MTGGADGAGGERRRVTVLFCDLVGSTHLSDVLDPEDYSDVMHAYYGSCARVIEGLGGWIADYLGDGLVVYFGYPGSHEDDPIRAVRAGLELVDAVAELGSRLPSDVVLSCRVGIDTGLVVIGESADTPTREPIWALGRTVNLAARLQGLAGSGSVVIGEGTRALVEGWFHLESLGTHAIKGIAKPVGVARVLAETGAKDRLRAALPRGLPALVNREGELALLRDAWRRSAAGSGTAVLLRGEAGIGKSRLALSLIDGIRESGDPVRVVDLHCTQDDAVSPLRPVVDHLRREAGVAADPERRVALLRRTLDERGGDDPDALRLLAEALIPEAGLPVLDAAPEERRQRAMRLIADLLLLGDATRVVVVEDLHWADPSTAVLVGMMAERLARTTGLLVATARPQPDAPWLGLPHVVTLEVGQLDAPHTAELAATVAGAQLPREAQAAIHARSEGIPLFVEELTRLVLDAGLVSVEEGRAVMRGRLDESVPGTVYDLLVARLGRLGGDAALAQLASVLGHEFRVDFLRAVAHDEPNLDEKLSRLVQAGVVVPRGEAGEEVFRFSHALVRDAAYGLLLRKRRRELHGRVADVLVGRFPDLLAARPELAAPHFTESGRTAEAIEHWVKAGERAAAQYALHEAIDQYQRALELVRSLPGSPERARKEIGIAFALGPLIQNASGGGDPRLEELHARVAELSHWLESEGERFTFLAYGYAVQMVQANYQAARRTAARLVELTEGSPSRARQLIAHCFHGTTLFQLGEIEASLPSIRRCIELYDPERHASLINTAGIDPGVVAWGYRAWAEWHLGLADTARRTAAEMLALAEAHPHPFRTATAQVWAAGLAYRLRDHDGVSRLAGAAAGIAADRGYEELERYATCLSGWALAASGRPGDGAETIRRGLSLVPHGGSRAHFSWHLAMLAEAELWAGRPGEALAAVERAIDFAEETGERMFSPELLRLGAEIRSAAGEATEDETAAALAAAAGLARNQPSLPFLLRTLTASLRLRRADEARAAVEACLAGFREGLDTLDVRDARAALAGDG